MDIQAKINQRQSANREILKYIENLVEKEPQLRFGQILAILNIIQYKWENGENITLDPFYKESVTILNDIKNHESIR